MPKVHVVTLDEAQRLLLEKAVRSGAASAPTVTRARILLKADREILILAARRLSPQPGQASGGRISGLNPIVPRPQAAYRRA